MLQRVVATLRAKPQKRQQSPRKNHPTVLRVFDCKFFLARWSLSSCPSWSCLPFVLLLKASAMFLMDNSTTRMCQRTSDGHRLGCKQQLEIMVSSCNCTFLYLCVGWISCNSFSVVQLSILRWKLCRLIHNDIWNYRRSSVIIIPYHNRFCIMYFFRCLIEFIL